jgi:hypothetical protein
VVKMHLAFSEKKLRESICCNSTSVRTMRCCDLKFQDRQRNCLQLPGNYAVQLSPAAGIAIPFLP